MYRNINCIVSGIGYHMILCNRIIYLFITLRNSIFIIHKYKIIGKIAGKSIRFHCFSSTGYDQPISNRSHCLAINSVCLKSDGSILNSSMGFPIIGSLIATKAFSHNFTISNREIVLNRAVIAALSGDRNFRCFISLEIASTFFIPVAVYIIGIDHIIICFGNVCICRVCGILCQFSA